MKKLTISILILMVIACQNNSSVAGTDNKHDFFPVNTFINGQIHEVDSLKPPIHKYTTVNRVTDTVLLSQEEFDILAGEFTNQDINDLSVKKYYKETNFADQSIPSVTFTYSTQNNDLILQRADVVINPDPILNDKVKSIYLEKISKNRDTLIVKKMYWKTSDSFEIIGIKKVRSGPELTSLVKVSWN